LAKKNSLLREGTAFWKDLNKMTCEGDYSVNIVSVSLHGVPNEGFKLLANSAGSIFPNQLVKMVTEESKEKAI
jgi:hypothetical protein